MFDSFPMYSFDGRHIVWESNRNCTSDDEFNIFIAEWVDNASVLVHSSLFLMLAACIITVVYSVV